VAQRWAEAAAALDGAALSRLSFVFTLLHGLHALGAAGPASRAPPAPLVVHAFGVSKARHRHRPPRMNLSGIRSDNRSEW
jgi:hypothetical protein